MNRIPPLGGKGTKIPGDTLKDKTSDAVHRLITPSVTSTVSAPPKRRVETLTAPENVVRATEVLGVGDLHGNVEILYKNLKSLGVINTFGHWIGADKRLVFLGDIMGDRGTTGLECMRQIDLLRNEARMAGGDITVLAGNHDDIAIGFLTQRRIACLVKDDEQYILKEEKDNSGHAFTNAQIDEQGLGIIEFPRDYLGFDVKPTAAGMKQIQHCGPVTLRMMRDTPEGIAMLKNISQMQLLDHIDDNLLIHAALSFSIARIIPLYGIDAINDAYQQSLRNLLQNKKEIAPHSDYGKMRDIFLFVNNRESNLSEEEAIRLRQMGINHVFHGHEDKSGEVVTIGGLKIYSVDHSAGKKGRNMNRRSIVRISTSGQIINGANHREY